MSDSIPDGLFEIVSTESRSDNVWMLRSKSDGVVFGFESASRVSNGSKPEKVSLNSGGAFLLVEVRVLDISRKQMNEVLDGSEFDSSEWEW